ncbi:MAG: DUF4430 domain-containing protein [Clostridiales bacterium]|nr:DUF4430 domain-containing protein [Clostridiales bacterium]
MKKDLLIVFFIVIAVVVLIQGTEIQSVDEYYLTHIDDINESSQTVFMSIDCKTILNNMENLDDGLYEYVDDGVILNKTEYVIREGDSAFDMLKRVTSYNRILMEYQGSDKNIYNSVYVQGINHIYEFSCGELSGWVFLVNGEESDVSCGKYKLKDGDLIQWVYTCDLGRDIVGGGVSNSDE